MFKTNRVVRVLFLTILVLLASVPAFAGDDAPSWLKHAAAQSVPGYEKTVPAVVLRDEEQVSYSSDGKLVTTENYAVKLLSREGRKYAIAKAFYLVNGSKIRDIDAWLIRPDGTVKEYGKKDILDIISDPDDVYNEGRIKLIDASNDVEVGSVFGYTTVTEENPLFYQDAWSFQDELPTLVSRYSLSLPDGWTATSITFNSANIKPVITGSTYSWEMHNLAPIPDEPLSPATINLAPRIAVNFSPADGSKAVNKAFANWLDVSRWATPMYDPEVVVNDEVAGKARELTANAKTELEKIRAIGTYVQNLQYISIDIGVGHGNGYRPRPSDVVLSRGYGDCKDKANLMRALLRALKIDAYPVVIFSGDPTFVREEWASPRQFNHCIIAVKVVDTTTAGTVTDYPKLGRLMIFDATDPYTPVGDLPSYLQGSFALIIAGENGGLMRMPVTPAGSDALERNINVNMTETGAITGTISERASGQASATFRREIRELSSTDYKKVLEGWLTRGATGAQLVNFTPTDKQNEAGFDLDVQFAAPRYGQLMQNRLLVFKPVIVGRRNAVTLTESKRSNPIEIASTNMMKETVTFNLPQGFVIDETPDPVNLESSFGKYSTKYDTQNGKLVFTRSMTLNRATIPADKYSAVKEFFSKILEAEQSPVVLLKK
jgi:hypothetical protein